MLRILALATAIIVVQASSDKFLNDKDEKMAFVFEVVRHGARPPQEEWVTDFFSVEPGMLTPEGMRQRYLLGKHNRERYT